MRWKLPKKRASFSCRNTDSKGFTLVEVMVVAAILAIMAGLMVPMVYKVWESNEKTETREKMAELKRAMVGDQRMVQNGIRMHYGFVGDNGVLPNDIADLVSNSGSFANWKGPYLVGAFDPNDYYRDAWGRNLIYTRHEPAVTVAGQVIVATLESLGPDGQSGTSDDLDENSDPELQILESEVWPTATLQGNLDYVFTAATTTTTPVLSAKINIMYSDAAGTVTAISVCLPLVVGEVAVGEAMRVRQRFSTVLSDALPVGLARVSSLLYSGGVCATEVAQSNEVAVYVSDGLPAVAVNIPTLNYAVN
ncbi:MAG: prepilin-type N-terminal cleavage/methylation domain-containing protein [Desulfobulbaceae bacterium]|nr:prepilin-type N-terminal cleavage/methylation domain-containing protein [Desulfobulbaceae bacterium]